MKTDSQLQADVIAELKWEPSINSTQIGVEVKNGIVTLAGHVDSYAEKWAAERAAQRVFGVRALVIELAIKLPGSSQRSDRDIAASAETALRWITFVPKDSVKIIVENGWVTLTGAVDWAYQREFATGAVRYLLGVTGLSDQITLRAKPSHSVVKSDIEAALKRNADQDASAIAVTVHGSDVTLSGTVHSWHERERATHTAWGSPGVRNVVDNMVLES